MTTLESRLREAGITCRVEVRERLAILVPESAVPTGDERLRAIQLARTAGFSHVCVELEPHGAALPGD